ncbi:MAG: putative sulfate/molybdate transporter [Actinomycetota bacterium]
MRPASDPTPFRIGLGEATGAVADLGVFVPLAIALIVVNGLAAGAVLLAAGALVLVSGVVFRVPFPVQPLKALTAVAVAEHLAPEVIHAAGFEIAAFLLLMSVKHVADWIAHAFTHPVVRALQFGVGVLLVIAAAKLVVDPPAVFVGTPSSPWPVILGALVLGIVVWEAHRKRYGIALAVLAVGVIGAIIAVRPEIGVPTFALPSVSLPPVAAFGTAFVLLVIPQLPLTFGNAVVAVTELEREYFGARASRVTPSNVCISCGLGNAFSALIGGMPMCHGSGGLTAHYRMGSRTAGMNLLLGAAFVALGLFFSTQVVTIVGLLPVWVLAAFLAYAGVRHAILVFDTHGMTLLAMVVAGAIGAWLGNLAVTAALALLFVHLPRLARKPAAREPD